MATETHVKALFIDASTKSIRVVELSRQNVLQDLKALIGEGCYSVDAAHLGRPDSIYVDGNCDAQDKNGFFRIKGKPFVCYGNGVVVAETRDGRYIDVGMTTEQLADMIGFVDREDVDTEVRIERFFSEEGTQTILVGNTEWIEAHRPR